MLKAMLILPTLALVGGCATITPAIREAVDIATCRLDMYVDEDEALAPEQRAQRHAFHDDLRRAVGIRREGPCPDYGR